MQEMNEYNEINIFSFGFHFLGQIRSWKTNISPFLDLSMSQNKSEKTWFYWCSQSHISRSRNAIPMKLGQVAVLFSSRTWKNYTVRSFLVAEIWLWENHEKNHEINLKKHDFTDFRRVISQDLETWFQWNLARLLYYLVVESGKITPSDLF